MYYSNSHKSKCSSLNCGCKTDYLTTPDPCPTPDACPDEQPCSEVFDSQCLIYNGASIICGEDTVVETGDTIQDALAQITEYFCDGSAPDVPTNITCGEDLVVLQGTSVVDALPLIVEYFCDAIAGLPTVTLASDGSVSSESIVRDGTGPTLTTKGLVAGTDVSITDDGTDLTIAFTGAGVTQQNVFSNIYDSGWVDIPNFNGTFGIAPIVGKPDFELRVVDRIVFIRGVFIIPLDNPAAPGNLITAYSDYALPTSDKNVWTTAGGGFTVGADQQSITSIEPIIPSDLFPDKIVRLNAFNSINQRGCMVNGGVNPTVEYLLTTITNARLNINGTLSISTQKDQDDTARNIVSTPGGADTKRNSEAYHVVGKHASGNPILTYENIDYVASAAAGYIIYTGIDTGEVYPFSFDGKQADEIGGFPIVVQVSYPLNPTVTLTDIQNAIASM